MGDNELLPCPFCGATYEKEQDEFVYSADHERWCPLRGTAYGGYGMTVGDNEDEITAWNTRAERICHNTGEFKRLFTCSECGETEYEGSNPKYCPNCGARVVD